MTKVRTFKTFDHELDDAPGARNAAQGCEPVCAWMSGELGLFGSCTRKSFVESLRLMSEVLLDDLDEISSARNILLSAQENPDRRSYLLGRDERVARFNYAYCHERTGEVKKAVGLYREFAQSVENDESRVAQDYSRAALRRAEILDTLDCIYADLVKADDPSSRALASKIEAFYRRAA